MAVVSWHRSCTRMDASLPKIITPAGAVLTAETGDMTRSPGHGSFCLSVTGSLRFFEASRDPLEGGVILTN